MDLTAYTIRTKREPGLACWTASEHLLTSILRYTLLAGLMLFPVFRLSGFPLPIILIFGFVLLRGKLPIPKLFFHSCVVASLYLLFVTGLNFIIINNSASASYSLKDLHYFCIPLAYVVFTGTVVTLFRGPSGKQTLLHFFSFFLIVQFIFMILQHLNPYNFRDFTEPYMLLLGEHIHESGHMQVAAIATRPAGFALNSTWAGFLFYPMGRLLYTYTGKARYLAISAGILTLAAARMAILVFIASEVLLFCIGWFPKLFRLKLNTSQLKRLSKTMLFVGFAVIIAFLATPDWFRIYIDKIISSDFGYVMEDYSYTYRMSMLKMLWAHPENWAFGGWLLNNFQQKGLTYVDSELVMRTLQFGIPGFLSFHLPFYGMLVYSYRRRNQKMLQIMVVLIMLVSLTSLTMFVASNPYFICMFSVLVGFCILDA